ncbi:MAG: hypothetical protein ACETWK_14895 [Candidatus Aminicenantaceae bacterium]
MRHKFTLMVFVLSIAILMLGNTTCKKESEKSSMLMDVEPKVTAVDRAIAESSKPIPIPAEPYPLVKPEEARPSAMLEDLEVSPRKAVEAKPIPMPEEPKPSKEKK